MTGPRYIVESPLCRFYAFGENQLVDLQKKAHLATNGKECEQVIKVLDQQDGKTTVFRKQGKAWKKYLIIPMHIDQTKFKHMLSLLPAKKGK